MKPKDNIIHLRSPSKTKTIDAEYFPLFYNTRTERFIHSATAYLMERSISNYIKDRFEWFDDTSKKKYNLGKIKNLTSGTVDLWGTHLAGFLRWCERKGANKGNNGKSRYDDYSPHYLQGRNIRDKEQPTIYKYQKELTKSGIHYRTVLLKASIAQEYCMYLAATGERRIYNDYLIEPPTQGDGSKTEGYTVPLPSQLREWVETLEDDIVEYLMACLVVYGGLRAEDVQLFSLKTAVDNINTYFPSKEQQTRADEMHRYDFKVIGSKGNKDRVTTLPRFVYKDLVRYLNTDNNKGPTPREKALKRIGLKHSDYVFFSSYPKNKGNHFSPDKLSSIFKKSDFDNWHPHMGRHAFAITRIAEYAADDILHRESQGFEEYSSDALLRGQLNNNYLSRLQGEMGHSSSKTTEETYLKYSEDRPQVIADIIKELRSN